MGCYRVVIGLLLGCYWYMAMARAELAGGIAKVPATGAEEEEEEEEEREGTAVTVVEPSRIVEVEVVAGPGDIMAIDRAVLSGCGWYALCDRLAGDAISTALLLLLLVLLLSLLLELLLLLLLLLLWLL